MKDFEPVVDTNEAYKPSQHWILVGFGFFLWTWLKMICFVYDLGIGIQLLIPNSQVITNSNQTPCDFLKQTTLNPITF